MDKVCKSCGNKFHIRNSHASKRVCCSKVCGIAYQKRSKVGGANSNFKNIPPKKCQQCGGYFKSYNKSRKYCSQTCYHSTPEMKERLLKMSRMPKNYTIRRGSKKNEFEVCFIRSRRCTKCNKIFIQPKGVLKWNCKECFRSRKNRRVCVVCFNEFKGYTKTCSKNCLSQHKSNYQKGELSHRWKGGKTSEALIIRGSFQYKAWRTAVFKRDNYTCLHCGQRGGRLNADHIKSFAVHPELRLNVDNGRTLCFTCHTKTPNFATKSVYQTNS